MALLEVVLHFYVTWKIKMDKHPLKVKLYKASLFLINNSFNLHPFFISIYLIYMKINLYDHIRNAIKVTVKNPRVSSFPSTCATFF